MLVQRYLLGWRSSLGVVAFALLVTSYQPIRLGSYAPSPPGSLVPILVCSFMLGHPA